jgi:hypothetical protein
MKKIDKDTIWTWLITVAMIGFFLVMSIVTAKAQTIKKDTTLHNQFSDYVYWSKLKYKQTETENEEKEPEVYIDRILIDNKNKKILLYSNYHLIWKGELGMILQLDINKSKKRKNAYNRKYK